jgi:predicted RNA-binding protein (virulence factor B family)
MRGYIKNIRPDNKIDVSLQIQGYQSIEPNADIILMSYEQVVVLRLTDNRIQKISRPF